ncbi:MAG TPA: Gfo/Idh/MocA family oxidoreductase [Clostridiaceae bacterium]|nr:Gfo/Idh/MocA family oxidoreductase [Clostridiaceae bacterium]
MKKLRIGVIGVGTMGSQHAEIFAGMPETELSALVDLDVDKAKKLCERIGVKADCFKDYETMLSKCDIDAVAISLPDSMHKAPVIAALQAGKHVLVEKPLATKLEDCDEMIKFAEKQGKTLMVNFSHRWAASYFNTKSLIESGKIGNVAMAYARKNDTIGVITKSWGWLAESTPAAFLSSHDIDLVRWFIGCEAKSVYARAYAKVLKSKGYDTLDAVQALVEFENGAIATFESGWIYPDTFPTPTDSYIEIVGEHGVVHLDRKSESFEYATPEVYTFPKLSISCRVNGKLQGAFRISLEHFVDCLLNNKEPVTSGKEARKVAEIVEGIHRSIESGQPVSLPL